MATKDYGFGKTFKIGDKFHALNGTIQYYTVTFGNDVKFTAAAPADAENPTEVELKAIALAQGNLLRALETLRVYGGQPVVTSVTEHEIKFTLEQANVYGDAAKVQPSLKDNVKDAEAYIKALFADMKTLDEKSFACTKVDVEPAF